MKYQYLKNWKKERLLRNLHCSSKVAVIDNTSLTKRLESIKDNNFKVKVLEPRKYLIEVGSFTKDQVDEIYTAVSFAQRSDYIR